MSNNKKRFIVAESKKHYGRYVVIDTNTDEVHRFHNLSTAKKFAIEKNQSQIDNQCCTACDCDPCDCDWGNC